MRPFPQFRRAMNLDEGKHLPVVIYALVDPRDGTVRYVGQTTNPTSRKAAHRIGKGHSSTARPWFDELHALGLEPGLRLVARCEHDDADMAERYWIGFYRSLGPLYNVNPGGKSARGNCQRCGRVVRCKHCQKLDALESTRAKRLKRKVRPPETTTWGNVISTDGGGRARGT